MTLKVLLISIVLLALIVAGFAVKMFFKKDGQFEKRCGSVDPKTGKSLPCTCGKEEEAGHCENS